MATNNSTAAKPESQAAKAREIYLKFLTQVEKGKFDESQGWRKTVLAAFESELTLAKSALSTAYANCQHHFGRTVDKYFEIVPVKGATVVPMPTPTPTPAPAPAPAPVSIPAAPVIKKPAAIPVAASAPVPMPPSKAKAVKVHADLIELCHSNIAEAFDEVEELIDEVDRLGDARALRTFVRKMRASVKKIENNLGTKAILDKQQANKILAGLAAKGA